MFILNVTPLFGVLFKFYKRLYLIYAFIISGFFIFAKMRFIRRISYKRLMAHFYKNAIKIKKRGFCGL